MKKKIYNIRFGLFAVFMIFLTINANLYGQTSNASCNFYSPPSGLPLQVTVGLFNNLGNPLTVIESGLEFNLAITTPGGIPNSSSGCPSSYEIKIETSGNLELGDIPISNPYQFGGNGVNQWINSTVITPNAGCGINVPFKFKPGITCDGEIGTFKVTVTLECGNVYTCTLEVDLKAKAKNYWKVKKEWVWGNLSGGMIGWKITVLNTNTNRGIGDYNIAQGRIWDEVTHGNIISITGQNIPIPVDNFDWLIYNIPSTTYQIIYYVYTDMCDPITGAVPPGTLVNNHMQYRFALANGSVNHPDCEGIEGNSEDEVRLVSAPTAVTNFGKYLTYGNNLNYAEGCEGEYRIVVSNSGNIPLTNLVITDAFPTGIDVTKISISGYGVNMDYTTNLPIIGSGIYNTTIPQVWDTPPLSNPTSLLFNTTSGLLLGGTIEIRIRFTITAIAGTLISNCATISYDGTFSGTGNWCNITLPPTNTQQACAPFTVPPPESRPGLRKCISTGQQSFMVGDNIPFRIVVSNHGQGDLSGTLSDILGNPPLQELELVPGSVTYYWGDAPYNPYYITPGCIPGNSLPNNSTSPPSWVNDNLQTQNLTWNINNMPGLCELDRANYLVIEFEAKVLPQAFGPNYNETKLDISSSMLTDIAHYNIMRYGKIDVTKQASSSYVEPGQQFNYIVNVQNLGSVAFNSIVVTDQLPTCVTLDNFSARHFRNDGTSPTIPNINHPGNEFKFPVALTLQAGERIELVIVVTANITDPECCNEWARGDATLIITSEPVTDVSPRVCVQSSLCCDMEFVNVTMYSSTNFFGNLFLTFTVSAGVKPIIEADIDLLDYHITYNPGACKPLNIGNLTSHIQAHWYSYSIGGILNLTGPAAPPTVNNAISWAATAGNSLMFTNQIIRIYFIRPSILNIWCCEGRVYYCFKVRLKDTDCNVCEKIVCGSANLSNPWWTIEWVSPAAEDQYKIKSLENIIEDENLQQKDSIPDLNKSE